MSFRKLSDKSEVELIQYVKDYLTKYEDVDILIGCDSQTFKNRTVYAIVVALYHRGKGAHVIFKRWSTKEEKVRNVRLINEVWFSIETAELLRENGIPRPKWIDIDLNPDPKYKSNEVFRQAVGLVEGMGYKPRYKTLGPIATYCADHIVRI